MIKIIVISAKKIFSSCTNDCELRINLMNKHITQTKKTHERMYTYSTVCLFDV